MTERDFMFILIGTNIGFAIAIAVFTVASLGWIWRNITTPTPADAERKD